MQPAQNPTPAPPSPLPSDEAGFSIIEGLIAALLLLVVTLGILPLFSRAMNNNVKGNDSTRQANAATDSFETMNALNFNAGETAMPVGSTSLVVNDTMALKKIATPTGGPDQAVSPRWELPADLATGDVRVMNRQRTLQQFSFDDYNDNQNFDTPLNGDPFRANQVHFKVVDVVLQDATGGTPQTYRVRMVKAF